MTPIRRNPFLFILFFSLFGSSFLPAQDVMYLRDGSRLECNIANIDAKQVSYQMVNSTGGQEFIVPTDRLMLLFKADGTFAVFEASLPGGYKSFGGETPAVDQILTYENELEKVFILSQTGESIKYQKASIPDGPTYTRQLINLLMIVYSDGRHEIFGDYETVAEALQQVQSLNQVALISQPAEPEPAYQEPDPSPAKPIVAEPSPTEPVLAEPESNPTPATSAFDLSSEEPAAEPVNTQGAELKVDMEEFSQKALDKTETLGRYFKLISNKETPWQDANSAIDLAVKLFVNEDAGVEVSSANSSEKKMYPIRRYLERLKLLKYDQVDISWSDISYVSKLRKAPDGNYYGVISFVQKFTGYRDGVAVYTDYTKKNIEVILKGYVKEVSGESVELWDVFLSDIGVINTRRG
jgi:hypothetical protein